MSTNTERLAWLVLRAVNQTQTKHSTARLAVPGDPEVAARLPVAITDEELLSAEEYLEEHGYLAPADITLTRGTYTITPEGLKWLETVEEPSEDAETAEGGAPDRAELHSATARAQEGARRPW